jgi:hypothetical protein
VKNAITVGTETGYLFEGKQPGSFAFVPATCLVYGPDGKYEVDELKYAQSAWDVKNMRFNTGATCGNRLYPDPKGLVIDLNAHAAAVFIERLQVSHLTVSQ